MGFHLFFAGVAVAVAVYCAHTATKANAFYFLFYKKTNQLCQPLVGGGGSKWFKVRPGVCGRFLLQQTGSLALLLSLPLGTRITYTSRLVS